MRAAAEDFRMARVLGRPRCSSPTLCCQSAEAVGQGPPKVAAVEGRNPKEGSMILHANAALACAAAAAGVTRRGWDDDSRRQAVSVGVWLVVAHGMKQESWAWKDHARPLQAIYEHCERHAGMTSMSLTV